MFTRKGDGCIEPGSDGREALKVPSLQRFGFPTCHFQLASERKIGNAIQNRIVDGLRRASHILGDIRRLNAVDLARSVDMDVLTGPEGRPQLFILSYMCKNTELNLGVVSAKQHFACGGDEGLAQCPSNLCPYGNVLQIRVT